MASVGDPPDVPRLLLSQIPVRLGRIAAQRSGIAMAPSSPTSGIGRVFELARASLADPDIMALAWRGSVARLVAFSIQSRWCCRLPAARPARACIATCCRPSQPPCRGRRRRAVAAELGGDACCRRHGAPVTLACSPPLRRRWPGVLEADWMHRQPAWSARSARRRDFLDRARLRLRYSSSPKPAFADVVVSKGHQLRRVLAEAGENC